MYTHDLFVYYEQMTNIHNSFYLNSKVVLNNSNMANHQKNNGNLKKETKHYPVDDIITDSNENSSITVDSCLSNHQLFKKNLWEDIRCNIFHEIASFNNQENISNCYFNTI